MSDNEFESVNPVVKRAQINEAIRKEWPEVAFKKTGRQVPPVRDDADSLTGALIDYALERVSVVLYNAAVTGSLMGLAKETAAALVQVADEFSGRDSFAAADAHRAEGRDRNSFPVAQRPSVPTSQGYPDATPGGYTPGYL